MKSCRLSPLEANKRIQVKKFYRINVCVPSKFINWNLVLNVMVFRRWDFGGELSQWVEPYWIRLVPLWIKSWRAPMALLPHEGMGNSAIYEIRSSFSPDNDFAHALVLDFPAFRSIRNKFLLFINHPVYGVFGKAAWTD